MAVCSWQKRINKLQSYDLSLSVAQSPTLLLNSSCVDSTCCWLMKMLEGSPARSMSLIVLTILATSLS